MKLSEEILYHRPGVGWLINIAASLVIVGGMLIRDGGLGGPATRLILVVSLIGFLVLASVILSCRRYLLQTAERARRLENELQALREGHSVKV